MSSFPKPLIPLALGALLAGCSEGTPSMSSGAESYNQTDVMFAQMMIPHHSDAIAMADYLLVQDGVRPEVVTLAEDISAGQRAENEQMNDWLEDVDETAVDLQDRQVDAEALTDASVSEIESAFLAEMIAHHDHGVEMSRQAVQQGDSPVIGDLAQTMVTDQTAEIELMEQMQGE